MNTCTNCGQRDHTASNCPWIRHYSVLVYKPKGNLIEFSGHKIEKPLIREKC